MSTLVVYAQPNGSYQWVDKTYTEADVQACAAATDSKAWIEQNATIKQPPQ